MVDEADVFIGTSGWHYQHWRDAFYPRVLAASKMLDYYAGHFRTVELNNTFYRLPTESAVESWREGTPRDFQFAVKGSRFLAHMKKLKDPETGVAKLFERVDRLERKLGPVVFQLPPWWEANAARLQVFLEALPKRCRYAFEFRNPTWHTPEIQGDPAASQRSLLHLRNRRVLFRHPSHGELRICALTRPERRLPGQLS